jgi:hypothetical protein
VPLRPSTERIAHSALRAFLGLRIKPLKRREVPPESMTTLPLVLLQVLNRHIIVKDAAALVDLLPEIHPKRIILHFVVIAVEKLVVVADLLSNFLADLLNVFDLESDLIVNFLGFTE